MSTRAANHKRGSSRGHCPSGMDLTTEQGYLERYPINLQFGHPVTLPRPGS
jgi:hypothetical protein